MTSEPESKKTNILLPNLFQKKSFWPQVLHFRSEASPIFSDYLNSVYGSSCISIFFGLTLAPFLSLSISLLPILPWKEIERERKGATMILYERKLNELPYTVRIIVYTNLGLLL